MKKMLIVYYTYSHGNTAWVAERLQEATGADLVQIETVEPYPDEYNDTVDQAKREIEAGYLPAIEAVRANPDDYDVVAIGTPTWWYTMAPAVRTFIEQHAWAGKTVIPFATDAGWMGTVPGRHRGRLHRRRGGGALRGALRHGRRRYARHRRT